MEEVNISIGTQSARNENNNNKIVIVSQLPYKSNASCSSITQPLNVKCDLRSRPNWQVMLQEANQEVHYSFKQLALKLDLSVSTIHRIFHGRIKKPTNRTFHKILGFWFDVFYLPRANGLQDAFFNKMRQ